MEIHSKLRAFQAYFYANLDPYGETERISVLMRRVAQSISTSRCIGIAGIGGIGGMGGIGGIGESAGSHD